MGLYFDPVIPQQTLAVYVKVSVVHLYGKPEKN